MLSSPILRAGAATIATVISITFAAPAVAAAPSAIVAYYNGLRSANGIPGDLTLYTAASADCALHNHYAALNGNDYPNPHQETPGKPGYTTGGDWAARNSELAGGSGQDLMLGVAIGYTVQSRLVDHGNFMTRGFDHTAQLAFSHNAAAGRLLGMTEPQIANAIAMAASSDASFAVIRAKPLSQWKGLASAQSALGAMNALFLARRGVQGPLRVVEGPFGLDNLLHMRLHVDCDQEGYEGVTTSTIKKYNAQIHTQSAV